MQSFLDIKLKTFIGIIFILSVIFEPMLYFMVYDVGQFGIGTNISRIMQVVVIFGILLDLFVNKFIVSLTGPYRLTIRKYIIFYLLVITSGIYGYLSGAYSINLENVSYARPFVEYVITLYYFVYFVLCSVYFLSNRNLVDSFFKAMNILFTISFVLGIISLFARYLFDYALISRHFSGYVDVGVRFHGLFGEPRDAAVGLVLWLSLLFLRDCHTNLNKLKAYKVIFILIAVMLTFSMSAIIGILISVMLLFFYFVWLVSPSRIIAALVGISLVFIIAFSLVNTSDRLNKYYQHIGITLENLENDEAVNTILKYQMVDIYPIWHRWNEIKNFNIMPTIIGSGLGSSSIVNKKYQDYGDLVQNPRSNLVRYFFDIGILGVILYLWFFLSILKKMSIYFAKSDRAILMVFMILNLGMSLGHRSSSPFIYLGIVLASAIHTKVKLYSHSNEHIN